MKEVWVEIPGTGGAYFVSSHGRIKSVAFSSSDKNGRVVHYSGKILSPLSNGVGYEKVGLRINGIKTCRYVHRLVAEAFIPNPENKEEVNHIDFNPHNNTVDNLEWVTGRENYLHSERNGRYTHTEQWIENAKAAVREALAKPVIGRRISDGVVIRYEALNDCRNDGFQPSCVCNCCHGKRASHKGYSWSYETTPEAWDGRS